MNETDRMIDRYYDSLYERYQEEAKVPYEDYRELEKKYEKLENQLKDIINYIQDDDAAGAYEYIKSEDLI